MSHKGTVKCSQARVTCKDIIDTRYGCANRDGDDPEQVHSEPELLQIIRVTSQKMVGSTQYQTALCAAEEDPQHNIVSPRHIEKAWLREDLHESDCDQW